MTRAESRPGAGRRGLTPDQALVEFGACLARLSAAENQQALDYASARYVDDPTDAACAVAALLARAGADLDRARAFRAERGEGALCGTSAAAPMVGGFGRSTSIACTKCSEWPRAIITVRYPRPKIT